MTSPIKNTKKQKVPQFSEEAFKEAFNKYRLRITRKTTQKVREAIAKMRGQRLKSALRKTMRMTFLSRSERMKLAHTRQYLGYDLEELTVPYKISYEELVALVNFHGLEDKFEEWQHEAEEQVRIPKIMQMIPEESESTEVTTQESIAKLRQLTQPRKLDKEKFKKIKV